MVIAVVALIVIGPERLPRVARTLGHLFGRLQRYVNDVKADINREIELDELRKFKTTFEDAARGFESSARDVQSEVAKTESELNALAKSADPAAPDATAGVAADTSVAAAPADGATSIAVPATPTGDTSATPAADAQSGQHRAA